MRKLFRRRAIPGWLLLGLSWLLHWKNLWRRIDDLSTVQFILASNVAMTVIAAIAENLLWIQVGLTVLGLALILRAVQQPSAAVQATPPVAMDQRTAAPISVHYRPEVSPYDVHTKNDTSEKQAFRVGIGNTTSEPMPVEVILLDCLPLPKGLTTKQPLAEMTTGASALNLPANTANEPLRFVNVVSEEWLASLSLELGPWQVNFAQGCVPGELLPKRRYELNLAVVGHGKTLRTFPAYVAAHPYHQRLMFSLAPFPATEEALLKDMAQEWQRSTTERITARDWRELADRFAKIPREIRSEWRMGDTSTEIVSWEKPTGGPSSKDCEALCRLAGSMLLKSPRVAASLSVAIRSRVDPVERWLDFVRKFYVGPTNTIQATETINRRTIVTIFSRLEDLGPESTRACLRCAADET